MLMVKYCYMVIGDSYEIFLQLEDWIWEYAKLWKMYQLGCVNRDISNYHFVFFSIHKRYKVKDMGMICNDKWITHDILIN
ncbi:hypothetical protein FKM82_025266 [Ascaphus truei]